MAARHTFIATFDDGAQLGIEEFVNDDGTREINAMTRGAHWEMWGPPTRLEETS